MITEDSKDASAFADLVVESVTKDVIKEIQANDVTDVVGTV